MINSVVLTGRLVKDVELRYTQNGKAVASFTIAVNKRFKSENGPDADFINCVIWDKSAEALANYTSKGSLIGVEGSIQTRSYEVEDGKRYVTEVVANNFTFLETKKEEEKEEKPKQNKPFNKGGYKKR